MENAWNTKWNNNLRPMYVKEILLEHTDETHFISVGEIIELMEGSLAAVACLEEGASACPRESVCQTLPLWKEYDQLTHDFFYSKHLSDLIRAT